MLGIQEIDPKGLGLSKFKFIFLFMILAFSLTFAATSLTQISELMKLICLLLTNILPILTFVLFLSAGVMYGSGGFFDSKTKAKLQNWAKSALISGVIMLVIYVLAPMIIEILTGSKFCALCTCDKCGQGMQYDEQTKLCCTLDKGTCCPEDSKPCEQLGCPDWQIGCTSKCCSNSCECKIPPQCSGPDCDFTWTTCTAGNSDCNNDRTIDCNTQNETNVCFLGKCASNGTDTCSAGWSDCDNNIFTGSTNGGTGCECNTGGGQFTCCGGKCVATTTCLKDPTRAPCPSPGVGACDAEKCCPAGAIRWGTDPNNATKSCCLDSSGVCVSLPCSDDAQCKTCTNKLCGGIGPKKCTSDANCSGIICSNGQCGNEFDCSNTDCSKCKDGSCGGTGQLYCTNDSNCAGITCDPKNGCCPSGTSWNSSLSCCVSPKLGTCIPTCTSGSWNEEKGCCVDSTGACIIVSKSCFDSTQCKICDSSNNQCGGNGLSCIDDNNCATSTCSDGYCCPSGTSWNETQNCCVSPSTNKCVPTCTSGSWNETQGCCVDSNGNCITGAEGFDCSNTDCSKCKDGSCGGTGQLSCSNDSICAGITCDPKNGCCPAGYTWNSTALCCMKNNVCYTTSTSGTNSCIGSGASCDVLGKSCCLGLICNSTKFCAACIGSSSSCSASADCCGGICVGGKCCGGVWKCCTETAVTCASSTECCSSSCNSTSKKCD